MSVETYVVSVYRRSGAEATGLVERTASGAQETFSNSQGLWAFLCGKTRAPAIKVERKRRAHQEP